MKKLNIMGKLLLAALPVCLVGLFGILISLNMVRTVLADSEDIYYDQLYAVDDLILTADRDFYQAQSAELEHLAYQEYVDSTTLAGYISDYKENARQVKDGIAGMDSILSQYPDIGTYSRNGKAINDCLKVFEDNYALWYAAYDLDSGSGSYEDQIGYFSTAREALNEMGDIIESYAADQSAALDSSVKTKLVTLLIVCVAALLIVILFAIYICRYIRKNLVYIAGKIESIAHNDLTDTIEPLDMQDEIGILNKAARDLQSNLSQMIGTLQGNSLSLADSSRQLGQNTSETSNSMANINTAAGELARTASSQAEDISDIVGQMDMVNQMMEKNTDNANSLSEASRQIREVTNAGMETVEGLKTVTEQSVVAFEKIFQVIDNIEQSTQKISESSDLISSIAEQTNLLSLNASIEAARAGEAGRGFAVVADEIRNLSEQSAESVNVINQMLDDLQKNTDNASRQSDLVRDYVNRQKEAVVNTSDSFGEIVSSIETINVTVNELYSANQSLDSGIQNISDLISNLSAISEENAATAEELNATTDTVNYNVEILAENGDSVSRSAGDLEQIIREFKVT